MPSGIWLPSSWLRLQDKAAIFVLSHVTQEKGVPGAGNALRASSGPTPFVFNLVNVRYYPAPRLHAIIPPLPLYVCFSRGGLGVGEKSSRCELVGSTHAPSAVAFYLLPAISLWDLSGEPRHSMGLAAAYGSFLSPVYHPFVLREAG